MPSKLQLLPGDIAQRLRDLPDRMAGVTGLAALWLFGSFARGEATPISDVDLAYLPDETFTGDTLDRFETNLYCTIAEALHTDGFTFVNLRRSPAYFSWRALQVGDGSALHSDGSRILDSGLTWAKNSGFRHVGAL